MHPARVALAVSANTFSAEDSRFYSYAAERPYRRSVAFVSEGDGTTVWKR